MLPQGQKFFNPRFSIITADTILDVWRIEPTLHYGGFAVNGDPGNRAELIRSLDEIQTCYDWLQCQVIAPKVTALSPSSYHLKHAVEFCVGTYVSNGAFLAAVIIAGVPYRRYWGELNAAVAVEASRRNRKLHGPKAAQSPDYAGFRPVTLLATERGAR